ncbi:hypothetical protein C8R45DRAFT_998883 [Mycena sanguinolenta]|nr:hypothetical protein C8R45DRAFT_998883 [Mycena sanguinolenta]
MSHKKEVHWKLTVDEYVIRNSPESWTAPLPNLKEPSPQLPPPPQPNQDLRLPGAIQLHPSLTPTQALQLDFSFPSEAFRQNPQLTQALLDAPACTPKQTVLHLRISAGRFEKGLDIVHPGGDRIVRVGDVLGTIQKLLRDYDRGRAPLEAAPYMQRRIATVNGYCPKRDARKEAANVAAEQRGKGRFVDHLMGNTLFAGLTPQLGQPDNYWQVQLMTPERYA